MKPRIFVGSSTESKPVAEAIQSNLESVAEVTIWDQMVFKPSQYVINSLLERLEVTDYSIFVFGGDDVIKSRNTEQAAVRDNVVFELGMFLGKLGEGRCFIIKPKPRSAQKEDIRIPSDLLGLIYLVYDSERSDNNLLAALGPACIQIKQLLASPMSVQKKWQRLVDAHAGAKKFDRVLEDLIDQLSTEDVRLLLEVSESNPLYLGGIHLGPIASKLQWNLIRTRVIAQNLIRLGLCRPGGESLPQVIETKAPPWPPWNYYMVPNTLNDVALTDLGVFLLQQI